MLYKPISFPSSFPNPSLVVGGTGCLDGQYGQAGWSLSADGVTLTLAATPAGEWSGGGSVSFWPGDYTERAAQWAALRTP